MVLAHDKEFMNAAAQIPRFNYDFVREVVNLYDCQCQELRNQLCDSEKKLYDSDINLYKTTKRAKAMDKQLSRLCKGCCPCGSSRLQVFDLQHWESPWLVCCGGCAREF